VKAMRHDATLIGTLMLVWFLAFCQVLLRGRR
jgi:hypothetical protein